MKVVQLVGDPKMPVKSRGKCWSEAEVLDLTENLPMRHM